LKVTERNFASEYGVNDATLEPEGAAVVKAKLLVLGEIWDPPKTISFVADPTTGE